MSSNTKADLVVGVCYVDDGFLESVPATLRSEVSYQLLEFVVVEAINTFLADKSFTSVRSRSKSLSVL